jgi:cell wall-associated NlpC family hydrolase
VAELNLAGGGGGISTPLDSLTDTAGPTRFREVLKSISVAIKGIGDSFGQMGTKADTSLRKTNTTLDLTLSKVQKLQAAMAGTGLGAGSSLNSANQALNASSVGGTGGSTMPGFGGTGGWGSPAGAGGGFPSMASGIQNVFTADEMGIGSMATGGNGGAGAGGITSGGAGSAAVGSNPAYGGYGGGGGGTPSGGQIAAAGGAMILGMAGNAASGLANTGFINSQINAYVNNAMGTRGNAGITYAKKFAGYDNASDLQQSMQALQGVSGVGAGSSTFNNWLSAAAAGNTIGKVYGDAGSSMTLNANYQREIMSGSGVHERALLGLATMNPNDVNQFTVASAAMRKVDKGRPMSAKQIAENGVGTPFYNSLLEAAGGSTTIEQEMQQYLTSQARTRQQTGRNYNIGGVGESMSQDTAARKALGLGTNNDPNAGQLKVAANKEQATANASITAAQAMTSLAKSASGLQKVLMGIPGVSKASGLLGGIGGSGGVGGTLQHGFDAYEATKAVRAVKGRMASRASRAAESGGDDDVVGSAESLLGNAGPEAGVETAVEAGTFGGVGAAGVGAIGAGAAVGAVGVGIAGLIGYGLYSGIDPNGGAIGKYYARDSLGGPVLNARMKRQLKNASDVQGLSGRNFSGLGGMNFSDLSPPQTNRSQGMSASALGNSNGNSTGNTSQNKAVGSSIVSAAAHELGIPYVWGGGSDSGPTVGKPGDPGGNPVIPGKLGFDCSGLTMYALAKNGISVPHLASAQAQLGAKVNSVSEAWPGDLVFYEGSATNPQHVGIYAGNGKMIDAPYCVPTDTEILTRRGWVKYDGLQAGDETLGYNLTTNRTEWTPVLATHTFEDAEVVRAGIKRWTVECTPNHSWVSVQQKKNEAKLVPLNQIKQGSKIILSAPADTSEFLDISDVEAEILAWSEADGSIRVRGNWLEMNITQSKPEYVAYLRQLLADTPHTESKRSKKTARNVASVNGHPVRGNYRQYCWYLPAAYARDLLRRARYFELSAEQRIMAMSPSQRSAWLRGIDGGEGTHRSDGTDQRMIITQNRGEVLDAIALAMYLLGHRPSYQEHGTCMRVSATKPETTVAAKQFKISVSRRTRVWCPTTGLGSWTARQGDHIFVTGNTGVDVRYDPVGSPVAIRRFAGHAGSKTSQVTGAGNANDLLTVKLGGGPGNVGGGGGNFQIGEGTSTTESNALAAGLMPSFASGAGMALGGILALGGSKQGGQGGGKGDGGKNYTGGAGGNSALEAIKGVTKSLDVTAAMMLGSYLESRWNPRAVGSGSYGLWQLQLSNPDAHPGVSVAQAEDPAYAARFMVGSYTAAVAAVPRQLWATNPEQAAEQAAVGAERPSVSYYAGQGAGIVNAGWQATNKALGSPKGYETGSMYIESDQLAQLHQGEIVIRAGAAGAMRMNQLSGAGLDGNDGAGSAGMSVTFEKGAMNVTWTGTSGSSSTTQPTNSDMENTAEMIWQMIQKRAQRDKMATR